MNHGKFIFLQMSPAQTLVDLKLSMCYHMVFFWTKADEATDYG